MSWNEPNDKDKKDPWGGNDGGNRQQPPDLDEVFRKIQNQLRSLFGGKPSKPGGDGDGDGDGGGVGAIIGLAAALLLVVAVFNAFTVVQDSERGVVLQLGAFDRIHEPGLRWHLPLVETVQVVNVSEVRSVSQGGTMLSRDENLIDVDVEVQYRIKSPENYLFEVQQAQATIEGASESAMREVIGSNDMEFILGDGRVQMGDDTEVLLQEILDSYKIGVEVVTVNLENARLPNQIVDAVDDVVRAREDRERFANEAEAFARRIVPQARGQAVRLEEEAEGYRASVVAQASGEARRFDLLLAEYQAQPQVMRERLHLETMQKVLENTPKVLAPGGEGSGNMFYLPLDQLMRQRSSDSSVMPWNVEQRGANSESGNSASADSSPSSSNGVERGVRMPRSPRNR